MKKSPKDNKTIDIFEQTQQPKNPAIIAYNKDMNRDHQPGDVYCIHGNSCFHHLAG